jgi:hypothetical protein
MHHFAFGFDPCQFLGALYKLVVKYDRCSHFALFHVYYTKVGDQVKPRHSEASLQRSEVGGRAGF